MKFTENSFFIGQWKWCFQWNSKGLVFWSSPHKYNHETSKDYIDERSQRIDRNRCTRPKQPISWDSERHCSECHRRCSKAGRYTKKEAKEQILRKKVKKEWLKITDIGSTNRENQGNPPSDFCIRLLIKKAVGCTSARNNSLDKSNINHWRVRRSEGLNTRNPIGKPIVLHQKIYRRT